MRAPAFQWSLFLVVCFWLATLPLIAQPAPTPEPAADPLGAFVNIPDDLFKRCLLDAYDTSGDGEIDANEAAAATVIDCINRRIIDTTGIEAFINVTDCNLSGNYLAHLSDLGRLTSLRRLNVNNNDLEELPPLVTSQMTPALPLSIEELRAEHNNLTSLPSFRDAVNLTLLAVKGNNLTLFPELPIESPARFAQFLSLSAEDNCIYEPPPFTGPLGQTSPLTSLNLDNNFLTSMDRIAADNLVELRVGGNHLAAQPDLSNLNQLTVLAIGGNQFTDVNTTTLPANLTTLDLADMCLSAQPDLASFPDLINLDVTNNKMPSLQTGLLPPGLENLTAVNSYQGAPGQLPEQPDLSILPEMVTLDLSGYGITALQADQLPDGLENLRLNGNLLTSLPDLSGQLALQILDVSGNQLLQIEAQKLPPNLRVLIANDNLISQVPQLPMGLERLVLNNNLIFDQPNLSNLIALQELSMSGNGLSSINSAMLPPNLFMLDLSNNRLPSMNGLNHPMLAIINLSNNKITQLPALMQVNAAFDLNMADNLLGPEALGFNFPPNLRNLNLSGNNLAGAPPIGMAPGLRVLDLSNCNLSTLPDLNRVMGLETLVVANNQLSSLQNAAARGLEPLPAGMQDLVLANNQFQVMPDFSRYTILSNLDVSGNQLSSLIPPSQSPLPTRVRTLNAASNQLTTIPDFSDHANMRVLILTQNQIRDLGQNLPAGLNILIVAENLLEAQPDLSAFTLMRHLDLSTNALADFNPELLPPFLSELILYGNILTAMPDFSVRQNIMVLNLADNFLAEVSAQQLPHFLNVLFLSNNRITDLPDLTVMPVLRELDLSGNQLTVASADRLPGDLTELKLNDNQLTAIPDVSGFTFMGRLEVSGNRIQTIENLPPFLTRLDADGNSVSGPGDLDALRPIRRLDLARNPLVKLPDMTDLILMRHLALDHAQLSSLSDLPPNLVEITASGNRIDPQTLAPSIVLEILDLSFNFLTELPNLSDALLLNDLDLTFNQLTDLNGLTASPSLGHLPDHQIHVERNLLGPGACDDIAAMEVRTSVSGATFVYEPQGNYTVVADAFPTWLSSTNLLLDWVAAVSVEDPVSCLP